MKKLLPLSLVLIMLFVLAVPATVAAGSKGKHNRIISADSAIVGVHAIGFVDTDGAKLSAIVVEYNVDMKGADVSADTYEITDYAISTEAEPEIGSNPGAITDVYVYGSRGKAKGIFKGKAKGKHKGISNHVIIEVNTDYQLGRVAASYKWAMMAGVTQTGTIHTKRNTITPGTEEVKNYYEVEVPGHGPPGTTPPPEYRNYAMEGTYTIKGTEVFKLFTKEDATAFHAADCWEEATGEYIDVDLPYALYVPKNYNPRKKYALVLHIHDAGFMGDDPMIALTESQGPVNFASRGVQRIVKRDGLGGVIVVCPQIEESLRSTRDDYSLSAAVPATWQLMDHLTDKYNIDMNRIYGEGQSMGGMHVAAMAAQRDNYFAAWWANGCQWGSNFNLDDPTYNGEPYYQAPQDGDPIWTTDADGNPVNYRNWYYLVSDDNILINNCMSDNFSTSVWKEFKYLYRDLAGAEIPYTYWNPLTASKAEQNAAIKDLFAQPNELGIYWGAFEGGNHMATWIYSHGVYGAYQWLLSQTRESEMARDKLDLNKPFERADIQSTDPDREIAGGSAYLVTGEYGAGTLYYNSALYGRGGSNLIQPPGWWPLKAGAGSSPIVFSPDMFPVEGFDGTIHDNPYARVLVLQGDIKVAICSLELVNIPANVIIDCKNTVSAETGTLPENVWIHATHAITTPHAPGDSRHSPEATPEQLVYYEAAVQNAITDAARQAADSFQNAFAGFGTGTCDVNMNKDVLFPDGKWYMGLEGLNEPMPSNKKMTVLRVNSLYGDPIGFFISYGIKPTCIDNSEMAAGTRQISSDVPGLACRLMEAEFGAPALFGMPAAGDQVPQKWCWYQAWDPTANNGAGGAVWVDEGVEQGLIWVQELGTEMGNDAIGIAKDISSMGSSLTIDITEGSFWWENKPREGDPEPVEVSVGVIRFGDAAFVGFKPEVNAVTEQALWATSPFAHTLLLSFVNGDAHYMPDANACALGTTEWQKSAFAVGAAEELVVTAVDLLDSLDD